MSIEDWYDKDGYELNPGDGKRLSDEEIDAEWDALHLKKLDGLKVKDIPVPEGGFPDPDEWEPPIETEDSSEAEGRERPSKEQLLRDITSHGRERVSQAYGIPLDELPGKSTVPKSYLPARRKQ